jgi:hypothetical protein
MSPIWVAFSVGVFLGALFAVIAMGVFIVSSKEPPRTQCNCDDSNQGRACQVCQYE